MHKLTPLKKSCIANIYPQISGRSGQIVPLDLGLEDDDPGVALARDELPVPVVAHVHNYAACHVTSNNAVQPITRRHAPASGLDKE